MTGIDEQALIERALQGDADAFGLLVRQYGRPVYNLSLRMLGNAEDARDVSQIAFLKAWEKLGSFDGRSRLFSWIYRIALNEALNHRRGRRNEEPLDEGMPEPAAGPEQNYARQRNAEVVQSGLGELDPKDREVLVLRHFLGLSYVEIGEVLQVPEKVVKSRLHTALVRLELVLRRRGAGAR